MEIEGNGAVEAAAEDDSLETQAEEIQSQDTGQPDPEQTGDDAAAATEDEASPDDVPARPKKSAQERINELTKRLRETERQLAAAAAPPAPAPQPAEDSAPDPADYQDGIYDPAYIDALTDYKAEKAVARTFERREAQQTLHSKVRDFEARAQDAFPDGEPEGIAAFRSLPTLPVAIQEIVLESQNGPRLADYLGSRPGELRRLSTLSPAMQAYEVAMIEARLVAPKPKTATTAPEPTPQLRGQGGQFKVAPDTADFAAFERQYG